MSSVSTRSDEKPVLVLVHGATGNHRMWDPVRRALEPAYRILTPDLPGHGARRGEPFTLAGAVETVAEAVRSVAPAPVVVGGDSLGGYVTMASAGALPAGQLRGLVLAGCTLVFTGTALVPFKIKSVFNQLLLKLVGEKRLLGPRFERELVKIGLTEADARAILGAGTNVGVFGTCVRELTGVDFPAKVATAGKPVLYVNGGKDTLMMRDLDRYLAAAPGARYVVYPGVEHGVSLRRSADFAALVDEFVADLSIKPV